MADVLSQDEVDALLSGLTGGEVEAESADTPDQGDYAAFDFANQDRIQRGRMPTLEMVHDRFARLFRQTISSAMQRVVDVNVLNVDAGKFGEFMRGQAIPSSYHIFRMDPLKGSALVVLEGKLIFTMVNSFFGGKGTSYFKMEGRDFTPIESRMVRTIVNMLLEDYESAWQPVEKLTLAHDRDEVNPQFVSIVPPSDAVWVIEVEMSFEDISEKLYFCLPATTLDPVAEKLKQQFQSENMDTENTWVDRVAENLGDVDVELVARLGTASISGRHVLALAPGDVITLNEYYGTPADVFVENVLKIRGKPGKSRDSKAIQVTEFLTRKK